MLNNMPGTSAHRLNQDVLTAAYAKPLGVEI